MMSDEYRGWAWTRAFLGLQADEIHVCGDPSAVPLLRSICAQTGDELIENEYERFKPLKLDQVSFIGITCLSICPSYSLIPRPSIADLINGHVGCRHRLMETFPMFKLETA